jgi:hypothetical protein
MYELIPGYWWRLAEMQRRPFDYTVIVRQKLRTAWTYAIDLASAGVLVARHNHLHAVLQPQLYLFQSDLFDEVFRAEVRLFVDFFDSGFTAGVFFGEESKFCIVVKKRLSYFIACGGHAFLLQLGFTFTWD